MQLTPVRTVLALLLVGSAILFLVGSTIERHHRHHETTTGKAAAATSGESGGETGTESSKPVETHRDTGSGEAGVTIAGVNTESLALSIIAFAASLLLAATIVRGRLLRLVLLAVLGFGVVFAAGDIREVVHQANESNNGLATVAAILVVAHLAVAAIAGLLLRPLVFAEPLRSGPG